MDVEKAREALGQLGYPEGFEETLVLVKPDGVRLGIHPAVAAIYHAHQLEVIREERIKLDPSLVFAIYSRHEGMPHFQELLQYMTSGDCKAYVLLGFNAAQRAHDLLGATDPLRAAPTSVRGLFRGHFDLDRPAENFVHASDNLAEAIREIEVLFGKYPAPDSI